MLPRLQVRTRYRCLRNNQWAGGLARHNDKDAIQAHAYLYYN